MALLGKTTKFEDANPQAWKEWVLTSDAKLCVATRDDPNGILCTCGGYTTRKQCLGCRTCFTFKCFTCLEIDSKRCRFFHWGECVRFIMEKGGYPKDVIVIILSYCDTRPGRPLWKKLIHNW